MDQSFEKYELPQLTEYKIGNLNDPITIKGIDFIIWRLPKMISLVPDDLMGEFYQTFKEN